MGIGEQAWLGEIDENAFHNIDDPNSERRDKVFLLLAAHTLKCLLPCLSFSDHTSVVGGLLKSWGYHKARDGLISKESV